MKTARYFLDPAKMLVDAVAERLATRVRTTPEGAQSLAHILVVVPTSESGRRLRLALAERFAPHGVLPPRVVQPFHLVSPSDESLREATKLELQIAFLAFIRDTRKFSAWPLLFQKDSRADVGALLGFWEQLAEIWRELAHCGLLMSDVPDHPGARAVFLRAQGDEEARWQQLADFERAFFDSLHALGLRHPAESVRLAKQAATPPPAGVECVVLPALTDPVPVLYDVLGQWTLPVEVWLHARAGEEGAFDAWGRPLIESWTGKAAPQFPEKSAGGGRPCFAKSDIVSVVGNRELARAVATSFPPVENEAAELPSLGLCDANLATELEAAFLNSGRVMFNPESKALGASSLGRLADNFVSLWEKPAAEIPWKVFRALVLDMDFFARLQRDLVLRRMTREQVLKQLGRYSNDCLPTVVPTTELGARYDALEVVRKSVVDFVAAAKSEGVTLAGFLRAALKWVYAGVVPADDAGGREFAAAAAALVETIRALEGEVFDRCACGVEAFSRIARSALAGTLYRFEPEAQGAVKTEGWLELAWSPARRVALAGFREGAVPDSLVGHAFLPDQMRAALGLTSNARRLARDTFLFSELLACRAPHAVRVFFSSLNDAGDIQRPSRLLFLCSDNLLCERVDSLFNSSRRARNTPRARLSPAWRLRVPNEVPLHNPNPGENILGSLSPSAIDAYLRCPVTYFLRYGLGMRRLDEKEELGPDDFGNLAHATLERFARCEIESGKPAVGAAEIRARLEACFNAETARYGAHPTLGVKLQLGALRARLMAFVPIQERWTNEGWKIVAAEYRLYDHKRKGDGKVRPFNDQRVFFNGSIDRIDYHPSYGFRIIDYKTWDAPKKVETHLFAGGADELALAGQHGYPLIRRTPRAHEQRIVSVQLALYARALELKEPATYGGGVGDMLYLVLGDSPEHVGVVGSALESPAGSWSLAQFREAMLETANLAVDQIVANIFWPAAPSEPWRYDLGHLFPVSPAHDLPEAWIQTMQRRLEEVAK